MTKYNDKIKIGIELYSMPQTELTNTSTLPASQPHYIGEVVSPLQDMAAIGGLLVPLVIAVGFFFTMRAKLEELDHNITVQGEMTLLKIENKFITLSEKITSFHEELMHHEIAIKDLEREVDRQKEAKHDILRQLAKMGIDLYVIGENDRRSYTTKTTKYTSSDEQ